MSGMINLPEYSPSPTLLILIATLNSSHKSTVNSGQ
jgi:hypothetical protein